MQWEDTPTVTLLVSLLVVFGVNQYFGRFEKLFVCEMTVLPGLQLDLGQGFELHG